MYILFGVLGVLIFFVVMALVMKKQYVISSEVIIKRSQADVFNYIIHLKNQEIYSKWVMMDPNVKLTYTGIDGTVGFKAAWSSAMRDVGVGEQEITKIIPGQGYYVELRFEKPFKAINYANTMVTAISENESKVVTTFNAKTPFPMNLMVPMITKMLKKDMETNGANLKKNLEMNSMA